MNGDVPAGLSAAAELGGEMGDLFGRFDWASHPLGAPEGWTDATKAAVATALTSRFPIVLWLADELFLVYNDAYIPLLGDKHPGALGRPGQEVWGEIWDPIGPMLDGVVSSGIATWSNDLMLPVMTAGVPQERYFTFTYSPLIEADASIFGVFCAVTETTDRVLGERRLGILSSLGGALIDADSVPAVVDATAALFGPRMADVPFLALYLRDGTRRSDASLTAATGSTAGPLSVVAPELSVWQAVQDERGVVDDLAARFPAVAAALGGHGVSRALVVPVGEAVAGSPSGGLVVGLNPLRPLDEAYLSFCRLVGDQVSGALASVGAYEQERRRAEALEQLDKAKTAFLTNVSHEFRTPLTLMLGPLEDAIAQTTDGPLSERLEMVRRNGLRLLRMVNSLLEFARLEAGGAQPRLAVADLGALSAEIAASFEDVCAQAGIDLIVRRSPAFALVDAQMWETVLLNLLSNAFKFTLEGSITVEVAPAGSGRVALRVADTGIGIGTTDQARIFDRFFRPTANGGRSTEGSGIGLALVKSLVETQGGTVALESRPGLGTTVVIELPEAAAPSDPVVAPERVPLQHDAFVLEAQGWLRRDERSGTPPPAGDRPTVVVADDNADMRRHIERILGSHYEIVGVADGLSALDALRRFSVDLVVTDVMMPALDGLGLVAAIRADPELANVPIVLVSARAGLESAAEGLAAGADDYIVKPFRSSELLSRVAARLNAASRTADAQGSRDGDPRACALRELNRSLNYATSEKDVLSSVLACPLLAHPPAGVALGILDDHRRLIRVSFAGGVDPLIADLYHAVDLDAPVPMAEVVRSGTTQAIGDRFSFNAGMFTRRDVSHGASVTAPLRQDAGAVFGALSLLWPEPRLLGAADLQAAEETAGLVAGAVERLRTVEVEHRVASLVQDRLLQLEVRSTAAAVCTQYQPAIEQLRVGGDWYTAVALDTKSRLGISVGDVAGHGIAAAATMSQLRSALTAVALTTDDPGAVLDLVERYADCVPGSSSTTLAYGVLDSAAGELTYGCAGHPYPLLVRPDGVPVYLEEGRRPPIGAGGVASSTAAKVDVPDGSLLVLYTDGLIERRGEGLDVGMERLARVAQGVAHEPVGEVCARIIGELEPPQGYADDVAIVAVRPVGTTPTSFVDVMPADQAEIPPARSRLRDWLLSLHVDDGTVVDVLLGVGEAINNAIEHGSHLDPAQRVSVEVFANEDRIAATVTDRGRWDTDSAASHRRAERGRGLTLMHELADDVVTVRGEMGTRVTMTYAVARATAGP